MQKTVDPSLAEGRRRAAHRGRDQPSLGGQEALPVKCFQNAVTISRVKTKTKPLSTVSLDYSNDVR